MLKSIPGLKTLTLLIMTDKPHYRHEEYEIFDHFIGCCPQITTFEFNAGGHPYGGKKMFASFPTDFMLICRYVLKINLVLTFFQ